MQDEHVSVNAMDNFSVAYDVDFERSQLILGREFHFCGFCMSEEPGKHLANCLGLLPSYKDQLESREFMTARVYRHIPPRLDGCPMEDNQCSAC